MREAKVKLGASEFPIAMPLGALGDLEARGVDVLQLVTQGGLQGDALSLRNVRAVVDVAGAWGADPRRGKPGDGALTFQEVYEDEESGGLMAAVSIATKAIQLPFVGGEAEENPLEGEATD